LTHFGAKDKKIPQLLSHDQKKKKKSAFASVSQKPEAAQKTNSGASFLSSNGHRNHQKRGVLPWDKQPGVTGGGSSGGGGSKNIFPHFPQKKIFLQKKSVAAGLMYQ
jgi:hypothetical protein